MAKELIQAVIRNLNDRPIVIKQNKTTNKHVVDVNLYGNVFALIILIGRENKQPKQQNSNKNQQPTDSLVKIGRQ